METAAAADQHDEEEQRRAAATDEELSSMCRVRDHFCRQPIFRDSQGNATAYFGVTDFVRPLHPQVVDDVALCIVSQAPLYDADIIVSIADRSSGAITHAVAQRTGLPYTLANWYPSGSPGEVEVEACAGFSGNGHVFLNGLSKGQSVVVLVDVLKSGRTALNLINAVVDAGCHVRSAVFACEIVEAKGRSLLPEDLEVVSLVRIHMRGENTKEAKDDEGNLLPATPQAIARPPTSLMSIIKKMPLAEVRAKMERVAQTFLSVPIHRNPRLAYPYSFFTLTDFRPPMQPALVEDMADLCVYFGSFNRCDIVVSECDRGGGPLAQAVSARTQKPFSLANWYPSGEGVGASSHVQVGFSGEGSIVVNGIKLEDRCIFLDDMLSSGGTAEGVLRGIVQLGGIPVEGVFISEKLYPAPSGRDLPIRKGKEHLSKIFPYLEVTTVVQFVASGEVTTAPQCRIGDM